jgi:hypothetical protein
MISVRRGAFPRRFRCSIPPKLSVSCPSWLATVSRGERMPMKPDLNKADKNWMGGGTVIFKNAGQRKRARALALFPIRKCGKHRRRAPPSSTAITPGRRILCGIGGFGGDVRKTPVLGHPAARLPRIHFSSATAIGNQLLDAPLRITRPARCLPRRGPSLASLRRGSFLTSAGVLHPLAGYAR